LQTEKLDVLQETTQSSLSITHLLSVTAATNGDKEETFTTSNHIKDLVEADTTSTPGVLNLCFYNILIF
jgi:hypothetical protein